MAYILEEISQADQEIIMNDFIENSKLIHYLTGRGGYFNNRPGLKWVVDREKNSYLFRAPKPPMTRGFWYFFFLDKKVHVLCADNFYKPTISRQETLSSGVFGEMEKAAAKDAFSVHGVDESSYAVSFLGDE